MLKIVSLDNADAYRLYKEGLYPSHLLYGAIELENAGYNVKVLSKSTRKHKLLYNIENAYKVLKESPDIIFIPFITRGEGLLCVLKLLRIINIPILGFAHKTIKTKRRNRFWKKIFFRTYDRIFFLSPLTMKESMKNDVIIQKQALLVPWGGDLKFYDRISKLSFPLKKFTFISTGKENRDFKVLIEAFNDSDINLKVYTSPHGGLSYCFLGDYKDKYANIDINLIENDATSFLNLARETSLSSCIVIPLLKSEIHYCVGLSSVVEAFALGKAVISTCNPYFPVDLEKEGVGIYVNDLESWKQAIRNLDHNAKMYNEMSIKARELSKIYNMENCGACIIHSIKSLYN